VSEEELARLRAELERARAEAARDRAERDQLLEMMRQANERLILAGLRSETLRERLAAALEASGTGTFRVELGSGALEADPQLFALLGGGTLATIDAVLARVEAEDREHVAAAWAACRDDASDLEIDFRVRAEDGSVRWLAMRGRTHVGAPGSAAYVLGACVDLTDRKRVAEERAANRAKDEFLAILGHELRNPLAPILTALHLLRRKAERGVADTAKERAIIERQVEHLVRLVDDLLDVARITRGKITLEPRTVDVAEFVATAVELSVSLIERRGHRIELDVPTGELFVDGDPARLAQIVTNLLTNAAKYTPQGGRIVVRARRAGANAEVSVEDNGVGIPPHLLAKVFDLFVQDERASDRRDGGLGIGLTIVKNLARMHGGEVIAESEGAGRGSRFTLRVPARQVAEPSVRAAAALAAVAAISQRVLIVDDNTDVAELVAEVLRAHGHTVEVAHDGAAALRVAEAFLPETALVDIGLPIMDGYELAANLKARLGEACPRLIAITGYGQPGDRARAEAAGFERHLVKPVDVERLISVLHRAS
jgi:PAS domain S-box-containing protein